MISTKQKEGIVTYAMRPDMSLATREASGSCEEPFIHVSILGIPVGQESGLPPTVTLW